MNMLIYILQFVILYIKIKIRLKEMSISGLSIIDFCHKSIHFNTNSLKFIHQIPLQLCILLRLLDQLKIKIVDGFLPHETLEKPTGIDPYGLKYRIASPEQCETKLNYKKTPTYFKTPNEVGEIQLYLSSNSFMASHNPDAISTACIGFNTLIPIFYYLTK